MDRLGALGSRGQPFFGRDACRLGRALFELGFCEQGEGVVQAEGLVELDVGPQPADDPLGGVAVAAAHGRRPAAVDVGRGAEHGHAEGLGVALQQLGEVADECVVASPHGADRSPDSRDDRCDHRRRRRARAR